MNEESRLGRPRSLRAFVAGAVLLVGALGGAFVARLFVSAPQPSGVRQSRPIVQIVRQQPGLPDISDLVDRLCPSVAVIVPHGSDPATNGGGPMAPALQYSADGWLVTSASSLPQMPADAVFGDGRRVELSEFRVDPVSGLAVAKTADPSAPVAFSDQAFPRVGQFGITLSTPAGSGCSAALSMISSDFIADGGATIGYVRIQPPPESWSPGTPLLGADGRVLGFAVDDPAASAIPAPTASVTVDELIRNSLSPSTGFGFRAVDYGAPFANRLGTARSGAGVALVQPKSAAATAGLQAGDVILAVDGQPISSASELNRALDAQSTKAALTIQRRADQLTITIKRSAHR